MRRVLKSHSLFTDFPILSVVSWFLMAAVAWGGGLTAAGETISLESRYLRVSLDSETGHCRFWISNPA